jgi:hypothetical protein
LRESSTLKAKKPTDGAAAYERKKEGVRRRQAEISREGRDIAPLLPVLHPWRKWDAARSFRLFCEIYFPDVFYLPWSDEHVKVIAKIERAVLRGELFALAMPRGSGKSSLCEAAALWALLFGYCPFVMLLAADEEKATERLQAIKTELTIYDRLRDDFPEVCQPIRALEGITQRCKGQLYNCRGQGETGSADRGRRRPQGRQSGER